MSQADRRWWNERLYGNPLRKDRAEADRNAAFEAMGLTRADLKALEDEIVRENTPQKSKMPNISTNIYRAPVTNADDAVAIGILNLTKEEAEVLRALAQQVQRARMSKDEVFTVSLSWRVNNVDLNARTNKNPDWKPEANRVRATVQGVKPYLASWRMGEMRMASFSGPDYGPLPEGWYREAKSMETLQPVFVSPNNQKFIYDAATNSLKPYPNGFVCANGHPLDSDASWCDECARQDREGVLRYKLERVVQPMKQSNTVEDRFSGLDI